MARFKRPANETPSQEAAPAEASTKRIPMKLKLPSLDAAFDSEALHLSEAGVFLAMEKPMAIGSVIDLELLGQSGGLLLHADLEVIRQQTHPPPVGVEARFVNVSYEAQALVDRMRQDEKIFGDFTLENMLGRGGMATVHRARAMHGPMAGRRVAIKRMLKKHAGDQTFVRTMETEADILKALKHPNIVEMYDIGVDGESIYIAMELIEGCDLQDIIYGCIMRGIEIPIDFACFVTETVAHALDHVHTATGEDGKPFGIIHRDVGPSNIFISKTGEIKLGDFGVSQSIHHPDDGYVVGKDPYIAPEHIRGDPLSGAADVFALGCVLYELLTNKIAFDYPDTEATWNAIEEGRVTPPRAYRPDISKELEECVMRAMSPRVEGQKLSVWQRWKTRRSNKLPPRYPTAAAFANELKSLYDPTVGTPMAIASVVRHLLRPEMRPIHPAGGRLTEKVMPDRHTSRSKRISRPPPLPNSAE